MLRALFLSLANLGIAAGAVSGLLHSEDSEKVKVLSAIEIAETLDGEAAAATVVEVTIEPGQAGVPHRHPGPGFGYVVEGEYEIAVDDNPAKVLKAGETFYEPKGCLHRISRNPGKVRTRLIAVVLHPRNKKEVAVPESVNTCGM
ncbi:cupin domain-containing protein [Aureliella helgolandensis]|uniref:Cupin domain protein n=1 Tax=Aureliella helgolandensis TaxID=2527968 RepID=A0A518G6K3_9BACT|nr:cupin domain-containing protein [Aureliella helgolandensis]QDV24220.1 Cupin domain protein [Aureliella helgolandensis]